MQRSSDIAGYQLRANDGAIGSIEDLLFDDRHFGVRWAVVDTGTWLSGRKALLPPSVLGAPDPASRTYPVDLGRDQIEAAPSLETDKPVSRQFETDIYGHYGWNPYWRGGFGYGVISAGAFAPAPPVGAVEPEVAKDKEKGDPNLRSTGEVTGYYVEATDDSIGHIEDFVIDETDWAIRYLMIDTKNWWPGKMVLISPDWLRGITWGERKVFVDVTREKVKAAPEFDPSMTIDRDYEERMYAHYGYHPYWTGWT